MSLNRFVYYTAVIGGWAAFLAWLLSEALFLDSHFLGGTIQAMLTGSVVGAAVGIGLNLVSGMTNALWKRQFQRILPGLLGGGLGGALGALLGAVTYAGFELPRAFDWLPRAFGWMIMGLGIGAAEGIYEKSRSKLRNGLIGGGIGGFLGGLLFDPLASSGTDVPSRAAAFVILGISVGALIGLAHVVLRDAWLTVVDGFRPGRQLILSQPITVLGRGDHLPLPFLGYAGKDLESEHSRIIRRHDGTYAIEDNHSRIGTKLNAQPVEGLAVLSDGDLIRLGTNIVRFSQRGSDGPHGEAPDPDQLVGPMGKIVSPPPPSPGSEQPTAAKQGGPPPLPGQGQESDPPDRGVSSQPFQTPSGGTAPPESPPRIPPPPPPPG